MEVGLDDDVVCDRASTNFCHSGYNSQRELDVRRRAVRHELEFAIWWDEADGSRQLELVKPDTLMEATVVQFHSISSASTTLGFVDDELVVEAKLALWRTGEVCPHNDMTIHVGTKDSP